MGTLNRIFLPVILIASMFSFGVIIHNHLSEANTSVTNTNIKSNEPTFTYAMDQNVPPRLSQFINDYFEDNNIKRTETFDGTDISIVYQPSNEAEIGTDISTRIIDLYQIWGITVPFSEYARKLELSEYSKKEIIISEVSRLIDSYSPLELLGEKYSISVSPETEGSAKTKLITIQEIKPDEIFIDGGNGDIPIVRSTWESNSYPLIQHIQVSGPEHLISSLSSELSQTGFLEKNNYVTKLPVPTSFVNIIKTGTTVTGGPGWELCERMKGRIDYPIDNVKKFMKKADISIISNEASFVPDCIQPAGTTSFCGKNTYLQNILDMGIDIISLTGNHMSDYGDDYFSDTLNLYTENNIRYFGSGTNLENAWEPLIIDTTAGKIAFIGFNLMGPHGVLAGENKTGTAYYDPEKLKVSINKAKKNSDIIWVDTHLWPEYGTEPSPEQISISQEAIDLGADIVTGVSSHEIQGMTFYKNKPIFYGLGNFLFDQMWSEETRRSLVLSITLFDGNIVHIDVLPTTLYDYCQPKLLEGTERNDVINYFMSISDL